MKKIKIGYVHSGYREKRNFLSLPFNKVSFIKKIDLFKVLVHLDYKLFKRINNFFLSSYFQLIDLKKVDLNHFFFGISFTNKPWITSISSNNIRYNKKYTFLTKYGLSRMAHKSCKKIIAISENSKEVQLNFIKGFNPDYYYQINKKIEVIHPSQELMINNYQEKKLDPTTINFIFVGADFFRKGGKEIVNVFEKLQEKQHLIHLTIVSKINTGDYASKSTKNDKKIYLAKIQNTNNISYYESLSNEEVIGLFKNSHVALLPTYADTYGYTVLEAQASGCPVISTNIRALPEVNNNKIGWLINVPKNNNGEAFFETEDDLKELSKTIEDSLYHIILEQILKNKESIKTKGELCLKKIKQENSITDKTKQIEKIYFSSIQLIKLLCFIINIKGFFIS